MVIALPSYLQWSHKQKSDTRQELVLSVSQQYFKEPQQQMKPRSNWGLEQVVIENLNALSIDYL